MGQTTLRNTIGRITPAAVKKVYRKIFRTTPQNGLPTLQQLKLKKLKETGERFEPLLPDFPPMIRIETTTRCNLACTHCPNSVLSENPDFLDDIDNALYCKIIDEIASVAPDTFVRPFGGGEPLMKKDLPELIRYARDKGIKKLGLNSNGLILIPKKRKELIEAGLNHIEVSIDAASKETYLKVRQSPLFEKVIENTLAYIKESKEHDPANKVTVSFVLQKENHHELDIFREFWKNKVDKVLVREYHEHGGLVDDHGKYNKKVQKYRHPCPYLWNRFMIHTTGKVPFCEHDWKGDHAIADIRNSSIKEIWHSKAYSELRKSHIEGSFEHPYCNKCTDWQEIKW